MRHATYLEEKWLRQLRGGTPLRIILGHVAARVGVVSEKNGDVASWIGGGRQAEQSKKDSKGSQSGQLYHLADDLGEQTNLVAKQPEKAVELQTLLKQLREASR